MGAPRMKIAMTDVCVGEMACAIRIFSFKGGNKQCLNQQLVPSQEAYRIDAREASAGLLPARSNIESAPRIAEIEEYLLVISGYMQRNRTHASNKGHGEAMY